jgi:hypothetical protein
MWVKKKGEKTRERVETNVREVVKTLKRDRMHTCHASAKRDGCRSGQTREGGREGTHLRWSRIVQPSSLWEEPLSRMGAGYNASKTKT